MPLLSLMFHRVYHPSIANRPEQFARYLAYLCAHYRITTPAQYVATDSRKPMLCLTFDDAFYDFYHYVYPLLRQHNIQAILAVPTDRIVTSTDIASQQRLDCPYPAALFEPQWQAQVPFCTWEELGEMQQSGHVIIASHSKTHADLSALNTDWHSEIIDSKKIIEQQLQQACEYFVYPYGRIRPALLTEVAKHYRYTFRIGNAVNYAALVQQHLWYRVDAEPWWMQDKKLSFAAWWGWRLNCIGNRLRGK